MLCRVCFWSYSRKYFLAHAAAPPGRTPLEAAANLVLSFPISFNKNYLRSLHVTYMADIVGLPGGIRVVVSEHVSTTEHWISFAMLRQDFDFEGICSQQVDPGLLYPHGPQLSVIVPNVADLVREFPFLTRKQLVMLCTAHGVPGSSRDKVEWFQDALRVHGPDCVCSPLVLEFQVRKRARWDVYGMQVWIIGHIMSLWFAKNGYAECQGSITVLPLSSELAKQSSALMAGLSNNIPKASPEDTINAIRAITWQSASNDSPPELFTNVYDATDAFRAKSIMPGYDVTDLQKDDLVLIECKLTRYQAKNTDSNVWTQRAQMELQAISLIHKRLDRKDAEGSSDNVIEDVCI